MNGRGRPLRFFALVVLAWVGARVAMLWPQTGSLPAAIQAALPLARAAPNVPAPVPISPAVRPVAGKPGQRTQRWSPAYRVPMAEGDPRVQLALMGLVQYGEPGWAPSPPLAALPMRALPAPERIDPLPDRWSLSSWVVARGGGGPAAAPGGQIGGGQAGARIAAWLLAPRQRRRLWSRHHAAAGQGPRARARPRMAAQPCASAADRRAAFRARRQSRRHWPGHDYGHRPAMARLPAGGLWPGGRGAAWQGRSLCRWRCPRGAHGRDGRAGAARARRRGLGAAQREAQRLDVGPSATLAVRNLRVALDWRQRVAGEAKPGSGLALTLGADF